MSVERLSMRTIREVPSLKWQEQLPHQQIAASCHIARSTVRGGEKSSNLDTSTM